MNSFLPKISSYFAIGFLIFMNSCTKTKDPVPLDEIPRILSVSIPGIPQENIAILEKERLITVIVPQTLPSLELIPTFTVSRQAKIYGDWATGKKSISLTNYCPCRFNSAANSDFDKIEDIRLENDTKTGYYKIQLVRNGRALTISLPNGPVSFEIKTKFLNIYFTVENYYGSSYIQFISITKTGSKIPEWIGGGDGCFDTCEGKLNEIGISLSGFLVGPSGMSVLSFTPGYYDLDLGFIDGTTSHVEKAILMK